MTNEVELSREIADSDMDDDVKGFLRRLILLTPSDISSSKVQTLLDESLGVDSEDS